MKDSIIYDIHTHHEIPQPNGIINIRVTPANIDSVDTLLTQSIEKDKQAGENLQFYSVGVHPWDVDSLPNDNFWTKMQKLAEFENVVAVGETGIDIVKGAPMFIQMLVLKKHIEISENTNKPLILHAVKSDDVICGLRRDLNPKMNWMVHGYRGKPQGAAQLIKAGCYISFGEKFNSATLQSISLDRILAETDESTLSIGDIISNLSEVRGTDLLPVIAENSYNFLKFEDWA